MDPNVNNAGGGFKNGADSRAPINFQPPQPLTLSSAGTPSFAPNSMPGSASNVSASTPQIPPKNDPFASPQQGEATHNDVSVTTPNLAPQDDKAIEKAVVMQARAIAANTRQDPHLQSLQLAALKTDYLEKHFGKKLITDGEQ